MDISLRRAAIPADSERLALIGAASFLDSYAAMINGDNIVTHTRQQHSAGAYRELLSQPGAAAWLAETHPHAAPVGYAVVSRPDLPVAHDAGDLELKRIYLLSAYQGDGTGAALMKLCTDHARQQGAQNLLIGVYSANLDAIGFYRHLGFSKIGDRQFRVGASIYDDDVMALPLQSRA